jgi:hypothetical protein
MSIKSRAKRSIFAPLPQSAEGGADYRREGSRGAALAFFAPLFYGKKRQKFSRLQAASHPANAGNGIPAGGENMICVYHYKIRLIYKNIPRI